MGRGFDPSPAVVKPQGLEGFSAPKEIDGDALHLPEGGHGGEGTPVDIFPSSRAIVLRGGGSYAIDQVRPVPEGSA
jgi:hypothetical protein